MFPYTATFENIAISAAQDLLVIAAAATVPVTLHRIEISWAGTTQEICRVRVCRRSTDGSGGTSVTPAPCEGRNTIPAACTVTRNVTTPGTLGDVLWNYQQNLVVPVDELLGLDALKIVVPGGGRIAVNLISAPIASRECTVTLSFSE